MPYSGAAIAYCVAGGLVAYSGFKGASLSDTIKGALSGNLGSVPSSGGASASTAKSNSSSSGSPPAGNTSAETNSAAQNQQLAKQLATSMGYSSWTTGQAWQDWVSLWNQESGWNIDAANPTSDARGIAQNINGYGPDYQEGNAVSQITWGINYIAGRYGSPIMAWAHEVSNNWY